MDCSMAILLLCVLSFWTTGQARRCGDRQEEIDGHCCDMCPPGTFLEKYCSEVDQTVCSPCKEGYYSDKYNIFTICEECQQCPQGYSEKCTSTTSGTCSCQSGFLCSNNNCSKCEKNNCQIWENPKRTGVSSDFGLTTYLYKCEPKCRGHEYFDVKEDICKPRTQCSAGGLAERISGNETHNSVCYSPETQRGFTYVTLCIGFVLLSLSLSVFVLYTCSKKLRKHKANKPVQVVPAKTSDFHLSKEESGVQLTIQDEYKDSSGPLHLDIR
ncbi:tumor necrosis factor receptor superfamily member 18 [Odontesthes bonariensis]|uniref:tumor necrosis factor receptor superfamily member 18 n=1 Tax=Odontesthes bonariensis TaxID=219752 RepID=UPI003F58E6AA